MDNEEPETFEERKRAFLGAMQSVAQWPHCRHTKEDVSAMKSINKDVGSVNDFEGEIEQKILNPTKRGAAPAFLMSGHSNTRTGGYGWQMATVEFKTAAWLSEEEAAERLVDLEEKLRNKEGMPSATDGSKGQWRSALTSRIRMLKWLLGELPNGVRMCECGRRLYDKPECHQHPESMVHVVSAKDYFDQEKDNQELIKAN